jgi:hypothetical protein
MKNTRDTDYYEHHKPQTYRPVVGLEELVLSNTISHGKDKYYKYSSFVFSYCWADALDAALNLFVSVVFLVRDG